MKLKRFFDSLPLHYSDWGKESVRPRSSLFQELLSTIAGMTTPSILQLLNVAVSQLEEDEVYLEIGSFHGATLIGAALGNESFRCIGVDDFSEFDLTGQNRQILNSHIAAIGRRNMEAIESDFIDFFRERIFQVLKPNEKIGVYLYDGAHDYRSQLLGLLLAEPFLSDYALIVVDDAGAFQVHQANCDFLPLRPTRKQLFRLLPTVPLRDDGVGQPSWWNGIDLIPSVRGTTSAPAYSLAGISPIIASEARDKASSPANIA